MNRILTIPEAEVLLEKYYDGLTSHAEEEQLAAFLSQDDLPEVFAAEKALFGFIGLEKASLIETGHSESILTQLPYTAPEPIPTAVPPKGLKIAFRPLIAWSIAAASLLAGVLIFDQLRPQGHGVAYVNGIACTDRQEMQDLANASIREVGLGSDDVAGTVGSMNDHDLVASQLESLTQE